MASHIGRTVISPVKNTVDSWLLGWVDVEMALMINIFHIILRIQEHSSLKIEKLRQLSAAAKIFLQKPLRSSVFVDSQYFLIKIRCQSANRPSNV